MTLEGRKTGTQLRADIEAHDILALKAMQVARRHLRCARQLTLQLEELEQTSFHQRVNVRRSAATA
jgi:hypothetical protein